MENSEFALERFVTAQRDSYGQALGEIRRGRKRSHWMWYVFPQIAGLGRSPTAQYYAIASLGEAQDYLAHPLLGARLRECVAALQALPAADAEAVFGPIDAAKLRSCLTLFAAAAPAEALFARALQRWFEGQADPLTLARLGHGAQVSPPPD